MKRVKRDNEKLGECRQFVASERARAVQRVSLAGTPIQTRPMRAKHYLLPSPFFSLVLSVSLIISIVISHAGGRWFPPASSCNVGHLFDVSTFRLCSRAVDQRLPTGSEWIYLLPCPSDPSDHARGDIRVRLWYKAEYWVTLWREHISIDWLNLSMLSLDRTAIFEFRRIKILWKLLTFYYWMMNSPYTYVIRL